MFTGQYSYMDDPSTTSVTEGFGLMFYNARWYAPSIRAIPTPLRFGENVASHWVELTEVIERKEKREIK